MRRLASISWLVALALATLAGPAAARPVSGVVAHAGAPIADAIVSTAHGEIAITGADGRFALDVPDDAPALTIAAPGFASVTVTAAGATVVVELVADAASAAEVIEVSGAAPPPREPMAYRLTADEIRQLPGAANDVLRAAQVLPGAARIPFGLGGLALRGTSPRDTAVYLDGIEVPLAFHFGGVTAFYPSAMLADLAVLSSGFDAGYGKAAGGVVALTTREPRRDRWRVGGQLGLFDSQVFAEGPVPGGGGALVGVRRSYLDVVAGPFLPDYALPGYWDFQVRTTWGDRDRVTPMVFGSVDRIASASSALTAAFVRVAVPFRHRAGRTTLTAVPWAGWDRLALTRDDGVNRRRYARPSVPAGTRVELQLDRSWVVARAGAEVVRTWLSHEQLGFTGADGGPVITDGAGDQAWTDAAAWADARLEPDGDRLLVRPGLRIDRYGLTGEVVVDPRLAVELHLGAGLTLRQAIGRYHQPPTAGEVDPVDGTPGLAASWFDQVALGLDAVLPGAATASVTGFASRGHRLAVGDTAAASLVDFDLGSFGPTLELLLDKQLGLPVERRAVGRARVHGVELAVRRSGARWSGLIAYTLARSERRDEPGDPWRPFELDQRHKLDVVGGVALGRWQLGARLTAASGNPYDAVDTPFATTRRLPAYVALDVRVERRWHRAWGDLVAYLDLHNATNRTNVEGRYIDSDTGRETDRRGLPILPFIGVELVPPR